MYRAWLFALLAIVACKPREAAHHDARPIDAAHVAVAIDAPPPPPPNTYVGSAKCGECHAQELAHWKTSWHAKALQPSTGLAGGAAHWKGSSSEAWVTVKPPAMRTTGPDGALASFPIDFVIGGKRMQDTITVFPDGRWQVLPIYFHVTDRSWVDYTEQKQGALTPDHPFYWTNVRRMANHECLDCHTTGLAVSYAAKHWKTTYVDGNVACEACHGPGSRHAASKKIEDIVHPVDAGVVGVSPCIRCHGPRNPLWPLLDPDHQFEPRRDGARYDELYEPIVVALPDGMSSDFFADGKPRTSSFEFQAMLQSACFRKGGATCVTCHTAPHEAKRPADLRLDRNETCAKCHATLAADHGHHKDKKVDCIACHMPPIVSGVLDHFVDHALDVPNPTSTHAVPDACGVCHPKKTPTELQTSIAAWWPTAAARQARRTRLGDAFDEATATASARALVSVIDDKDEAPTLRGAAMVVAARRFGPNTAPKFAQHLDDTDVTMRAKACEAIGDSHGTAAADAAAGKLADPSLRVHLACALALLDLHDPRGEPALQALADDPASSHLAIPHRELGVAKGRRKDFAAARHELERAVELTPYAVDAIVELAEIDAELGDFAAAHARIDQALALEPHARRALGLRDKLPK